MNKVINYIRSDLRNIERLDISLCIDENLMRATPTHDGRWKVTFKTGNTVEGVYAATNAQLEQIASEMLSKYSSRQFECIQKRDSSGYHVGQCYIALKSDEEKRNRKVLRKIFALKALRAH